MDTTLFLAAALGGASGIFGTVLGTLSSFFIKRCDDRMSVLTMAFCASVMTDIAAFELLPKSFSYAGIPHGLAGFATGAAVCAYI